MNGVSVCVDGGEPGTHNLPCLYRSCCSQNSSTSTIPEALQETDGRTERLGDRDGVLEGGGCCLWWGIVGTKGSYSFTPAPSERACKEGERD